MYVYLYASLLLVAACPSTRRTTVLFVGAIWLVMLTVNVPVLLAYGEREYEPGLPIRCDLYDDDSGRTIFLTFFVFTYLLPLTLIALLSARILCVVMDTRRGPVPAGI